MKQKTNLMRRATLLLLTMLCSLTGAWADELTVYDGTVTNQYVPVYGWYAEAYLKCEYVIPASELPAMNNGTISKMTYYLSSSASAAWTGTFQVFLKEVSETSISAYSGTEGATIVYEGPLDATGSTMEVDFSTNYTYNGGNLLVGFYQTVKGNYSSAAFYGQTVEGASVQGYSSSSLEGITVNQRYFIPKTTFTYTVGSGPVCAKPETDGPYNLSATGATIKWSGGSGTYNVQYKKASASEWTTLLTNSTATSYNLTGLTSGTSYQFRVQSVCSVEVTSGWAILNFNTDCTAITTFPWTEDFESYNAGNFTPLCWTNEHIEGNGTKIFSIYTSTNVGNSTHQLYLPDQSNGTMTKLVLPEMILPGNNYAFVLDVYRSSIYGSETAEGIRVYASGDGEIEGATVLAFIPRIYSESNGVIPAEAAAGWYTYELALPWSGTCYIILRGESKYGRATYMDNFLVREATSCQKPTGLVASGVTGHTATISWTSDANAWQIQLGEGSPINVTEKSYTFTGLNPETAYSVKVRTNCGGGDYSDWTNAVSFTTLVSCPAPTGLTVTGITSNSAWISWETHLEDNATGFTYQYKEATEEAWSTETSILATQAQLTGLTPGTDYNFRVKAHYADGESGYATINFTTSPSFPYYQNFSASGIPSGWAQYSGLLADVMNGTSLSSTNSGWSNGTSNEALDGNHLYSNIYGTSRKAWIVTPAIPLGSKPRLVFDVAYTAYSGTAANPQTTGADDKFAVLISTDNMATWTILRQWDNAGSEYVLNNLTPSALSVTIDLSTYAGQSAVVAFYAESTVMNADNNIHVDNVAFEDTPSCEKPTSLAVNYTGGTTAQVSWTSDATAFDIDVNGTVTQNVTNPYQLKNLYLATTYTVKVRAKNGSDVSDWTSPVSFTTDVCSPEDQKEITYELADSYGDGWNGAAINVVHVNTGIVVATLTLASGSSETTGTVNLCCGEDYSFVWKAGNYDSECSYAFYDVNEEEIFSGNGSMSATVNYTMDCTVIPWKTPTNLTASEIGPKSVKLSWTEESNPAATAWIVAYKSATDADFTEVNAPTNPFTLTGLTPETDYTVKVRPVTDDATIKWSSTVNFSTLEMFPRPTALAINNVVTTSAVVSWTGSADSYNLRYRTPSLEVQFSDDFENGMDQWTIIRNAEGNEGTDWGQFNPQNMNTDYTAHSGSNVAMARSWYSNVAYNVDNWMISPQVELGGFMTYWAFDDGEYHEHYDIYVSTTAPNPDNFDPTTFTRVYVPGDASDVWTEHVVDLSAYAGQTGYVAFRLTDYDKDFLYIDDVAITSLGGIGEWVEVNNVTSPYTLEDLAKSTPYIVQVQSVYEEGESAWASISFTTKSGNECPIDLVASDIMTTSAKLNWIGYQDSYNLNYRKAFYFTNFNTEADREGWNRTESTIIYGISDPIYGYVSNDNFFPPMGWNTTDEASIISPELPDYESGAHVRFYYFGNSTANTFQVGYSSTTDDLEAFAWSDPIDAPLVEYTLYDEVLPAGVKYVAFKATASDRSACVFIDDFGVFGSTVSVPNISGMSYNLTGLAPNTYCEWQVQGNLTSGTTAWSEMASFTTLSLFSGDVNGDGKISITDAVAIVNYVLGNPPAGFIAAVADVNGDGKIDISDAVKVVNIVLNKTGE